MLIRPLKIQAPWEAYLIPISKFPIREPTLTSARGFLQDLTERILQDSALSLEVFLLGTELYQRDGAERLASHAGQWNPQLGLGLWPGRGVPRRWSWKDFVFLLPGMRPRPQLYHLHRIRASPQQRNRARDVMLGLGAVIQIISPDDGETLLQRSSRQLLTRIKDPLFTSFPFHAPLFGVKCLRAASAEQLDTWFNNISVYIRESGEDKGILITSREPLTPVFDEMGARFEKDPEGQWRLPAQCKASPLKPPP